jgi:hypothetical protein
VDLSLWLVFDVTFVVDSCLVRKLCAVVRLAQRQAKVRKLELGQGSNHDLITRWTRQGSPELVAGSRKARMSILIIVYLLHA